jgi:hypothetical protein
LPAIVTFIAKPLEEFTKIIPKVPAFSGLHALLKLLGRISSAVLDSLSASALAWRIRFLSARSSSVSCPGRQGGMVPKERFLFTVSILTCPRRS